MSRCGFRRTSSGTGSTAARSPCGWPRSMRSRSRSSAARHTALRRPARDRTDALREEAQELATSSSFCGLVPRVRWPAGGAAEAVARRLHERVQLGAALGELSAVQLQIPAHAKQRRLERRVRDRGDSPQRRALCKHGARRTRHAHPELSPARAHPQELFDVSRRWSSCSTKPRIPRCTTRSSRSALTSS